MLTEAHLHIGQRIAVHLNGRTSRLRIVGDILDQTGDDLLLRGDWATLKQLDPSARLDNYEIGLNPGAPPDTVAARVSQRLAPNGPNAFGIDIRGGGDSSFVLLNGVIAGLALILISIALAGVFNTVLLTTREKAHDVAVLKAVGMAPPQVVAMMVTFLTFLHLSGEVRCGTLPLPFLLVSFLIVPAAERTRMTVLRFHVPGYALSGIISVANSRRRLSPSDGQPTYR